MTRVHLGNPRKQFQTPQSPVPSPTNNLYTEEVSEEDLVGQEKDPRNLARFDPAWTIEGYLGNLPGDVAECVDPEGARFIGSQEQTRTISSRHDICPEGVGWGHNSQMLMFCARSVANYIQSQAF